MTNPRDTGRWDAINQEYVDTNVRIDFAWGNIPIQPNDDRDTGLDPELDSHIIATDGWSSFPEFEPNTGFDAPPPPPPVINYTISGIRKQWDGSTLDYNMFYMFLFGRNHNLFNGNTINISGSDVAEYNKNGWIVLAAVDDDTFNTGGTKVTIFWNGAISETANGSGGTYTKV